MSTRYIRQLVRIGFALALGGALLSAAYCADENVKQVTKVRDYQAEERARFETLAEAVQTILGNKWTHTTEKTNKLNGWDGHVYGYAFRFSKNDVKGRPLTFRLTATYFGMGKPSTKDESKPADQDILLSVCKFGYFYCHPETFGSAHPKEWTKLLRRIHDVLDMPVAKDGVVCDTRCSKRVFLAGEQFILPIHVYNLYAPKSVYKNDTIEVARIVGPDGKDIPSSGQPKQYKVQYKEILPGEQWELTVNLQPDYDMSGTGEYKIRLRFRFGPSQDQVAESQERTIRIVEKQLLSPQLRRTDPGSTNSTASVPVEARFNSKSRGKKERFSDLAVKFRAGNVDPANKYGLPARASDEWAYQCYSEYSHLTGVNRPIKLDLGKLEWDFIDSSVGPHLSLPSLIERAKKATDEWMVIAIFTGKLNGKEFRVWSEPLTLTFKE